MSDHAVDLVTVAQALHWFDLSSFCGELIGVPKPKGHLAVWSYSLMRVARVDRVIASFNETLIGTY